MRERVLRGGVPAAGGHGGRGGYRHVGGGDEERAAWEWRGVEEDEQACKFEWLQGQDEVEVSVEGANGL